MKKYKQNPKIVVTENLKKKLDELKQYKRETYEDTIWRLIKKCKD